MDREYGCVGGDWKPLSGLIREPVTSASQDTFTLVGNFKNRWLRQPCHSMNLKGNLRSNEHYLSISEK